MARQPFFLIAWFVLSTCADGTAVDVSLQASPAMSFTSLQLDVAQDSRHDTLTFGDAGVVQVPTSLRLLLKGSHANFSAVAFDTDGDAHSATAALDLKRGTVQSVTLDLSVARNCPATPISAGEVAVFDDSIHGTATVLGYNPTHASTPTNAANACSGSSYIEYSAMTQYSDGFGVYDPAGAQWKHVSLRLWASVSSQWLLAVANDVTQTSFVYPDPQQCTPNNAAPCLQTLEPSWHRFEFDIPANAGTLTQIYAQYYGPTAATPFIVRMDDVRVSY